MTLLVLDVFKVHLRNEYAVRLELQCTCSSVVTPDALRLQLLDGRAVLYLLKPSHQHHAPGLQAGEPAVQQPWGLLQGWLHKQEPVPLLVVFENAEDSVGVQVRARPSHCTMGSRGRGVATSWLRHGYHT